MVRSSTYPDYDSRRLLIILLLSRSSGFQRGAPLTACRDLVPRHGFPSSSSSSSTSASSPRPANISLDSDTLQPNQYLRVALRSDRPFKGFLVKAESAEEPGEALGTWSIPWYSRPDAQYLHCGAKAQSAVTHSGPEFQGGLKEDLFLVSLQWRPPLGFQGTVVVRGTLVEDYQNYWTDILSHSVTIYNTTLEGELVEGEVDEAAINLDLANALHELSVPTVDVNLTEWIPEEKVRQPGKEKAYQRLKSEYGTWQEKSGGLAFREFTMAISLTFAHILQQVRD